MATYSIGSAGMATALHHLLALWLRGDSRLHLAPLPDRVRDRLEATRGDLAVLSGADDDLMGDAQALLLVAELLVDGADDKLGDATGDYGVLNDALAMADLQGAMDQYTRADDEG